MRTKRITRRSVIAGIAVAGAVLTAACLEVPLPPGRANERVRRSSPNDRRRVGTEPLHQPPATAAPAAAAAPSSASSIQLAWWTHGAEEVNKRTMLGKLVDTYQKSTRT